MDSKVDSPTVSTLHAEGRHIEAEWERLKVSKAREDATEEDLASHRLSFFLGAIAVWQAIQDAGDDDSVVDDLQDELEAFLAAMEAEGHITLSDGQSLQ
jgi:hypothetical protein